MGKRACAQEGEHRWAVKCLDDPQGEERQRRGRRERRKSGDRGEERQIGRKGERKRARVPAV